LPPDSLPVDFIELELAVTDLGANTVTAQVSVEVTRDNDPPQAVIVPVDPVAQDVLVTLDGSGSFDPNSEQTADLSYQWTQVGDLTVPVEVVDAASAVASFTSPILAPEAPTLVLSFQLEVTDPDSLAHSEQIDIDVVPDDPPAP
jgi:hypothetical protein